MTAAQIAATVIPDRTGREKASTSIFAALMWTALALAFLGLGAIVYDFASDGLPVISWDFITRFPSRVIPERAGIQSAIFGTIYLMIICTFLVVPIGVMTAVYLEEYADADRWWNRMIEINIQNLSAVPSVVYGILGLAFIVRGPLSLGPVAARGRHHARTARAPGRDHRGPRGDPGRAAVDPRGLAGARRDAVADDLEAGAAGIDRRHLDRRHPRALARDRRDRAAAGHRCRGVPALQSDWGSTASFTALPIQIFAWTQDPDPAFITRAAGAIVVLMVILLLMNSVAIWLRNRYEQKW